MDQVFQRLQRSALLQRPARLQRTELDIVIDGDTSEYCPRLGAWTGSVTQALRAGAVLWIDYGLPRRQYYLPERREGTLRTHFRQRAHDDPLQYPGLQDITAWVDREMHAMAGSDGNHLARLAAQARRLIMPGDMGESFKAMAWLRGLELPLSGFAPQDLRHKS